MIIAVANSRKEKIWKNIEISWDDFIKKVSNTNRTAESVVEYKKLPKPKQDDIKDVGGFVGGKLKGGMRKKGFVEFRSMLTLDMDYAEHDIWERITMLYDFTCCVYSTHKHTDEKPRLRLIVPFSRNIGEDEYMAVGRMIASDIGIEMFDDTTYEPSRLMYWPSTSCDGEFIFQNQDGLMLNPDTVLLRYEDWKDSSQWPVSSRQTSIINHNISKQADPLDKEGIIGAFCRTYTITETIEKYLFDIYKPSLMEGRYDYVPAESTAGVLIYDDKFSYSHHATDPACGKLLNAFDLVRLHKFGDLDIEAKEGTPINKLPSYLAMQDMAVHEAEVKKQIVSKKMDNAKDDFIDEDWLQGLEINKNGEIKNTLTNMILILRHDPQLIAILYNELREGVDIDGEVPWKRLKLGWNKTDEASLAGYVDKVYNLYAPGKLKEALLKVAVEKSRHPIKEYLLNLPKWDGIKRVDELLVKYLGAEDNVYVRESIRKTLVAAIARTMTPGIKFDTVLVLNGPQGIGKSTLFSKLAGKFFSDSLSISDMRDKTAAEKLQGYWILEIGELAGIRKVDEETLKSFLSRQDDKFRASYGYLVEDHPRQCIIVGTTNQETGFLRDITGGRRFWPVKTTGSAKSKPWYIDDVDQLWAEAMEYYKQGEKLILSNKAEKTANAAQVDALESDEREGLVEEYLEKLLPSNWNDMDLYARRSFLRGDEFSENINGIAKREQVCTMEIWCELFGKEATAMRKIDSYEINAIMRKIDGWEKYKGNKHGNSRVPIYGMQRIYVRCCKQV